MKHWDLTLRNKMGNDRTIAQCAWTSTISQKKKEEKTDEDVKRVVQMLIRDLHTSPLESVVMTFIYEDSQDEVDSLLDQVKTFRHLTVHRIGWTKLKMTLNFHALMKYRNATTDEWVFTEMFRIVKEEGFVKHCVDQIEAMEK